MGKSKVSKECSRLKFNFFLPKWHFFPLPQMSNYTYSNLPKKRNTQILQPQRHQALTYFYLLTYGDYYRNLHVMYICLKYLILWSTAVGY